MSALKAMGTGLPMIEGEDWQNLLFFPNTTSTLSLNYFLLVLERANIYLLNLDPYKDLRMEGWRFENAFDLRWSNPKFPVR